MVHAATYYDVLTAGSVHRHSFLYHVLLQNVKSTEMCGLIGEPAADDVGVKDSFSYIL
jgi:hypothetical protein